LVGQLPYEPLPRTWDVSGACPSWSAASDVSRDTYEVDGSATGARLTPVAASAAGDSAMPERIMMKDESKLE
jgi:hypothetical protein